MTSKTRRLLLLCSALGLFLVSNTGCGPVQASMAITESAKALENAQAAQADTLAPYPYYRAEAFLYMAKTKAGFAEYEIAREYAGKAKADAEAKAKADAAKMRAAAPAAVEVGDEDGGVSPMEGSLVHSTPKAVHEY